MSTRPPLTPEMIEASRAESPGPDLRWYCYCGRASVGAVCWNCGSPRPEPEAPPEDRQA